MGWLAQMELDDGRVVMEPCDVGSDVVVPAEGTIQLDDRVSASIFGAMPHDFGDGRGRTPALRLFLSGAQPNRTGWLEVGQEFAVGTMRYAVVAFGLQASSDVIIRRTA